MTPAAKFPSAYFPDVLFFFCTEMYIYRRKTLKFWLSDLANIIDKRGMFNRHTNKSSHLSKNYLRVGFKNRKKGFLTVELSVLLGRPTNKPTDRLTDRVIEKFHFQQFLPTDKFMSIKKPVCFYDACCQ